MAEEKEKGAGQVSRRDFLKDAGLLIGGAAVGAAAGAGVTAVVAPPKEVVKEVVKEVPVTKEVTKEVKVPTTGVLEPASEPEETHIITAGLGGIGGDRCVADVKNGKIVRIRPLHYDWKYTKEELAPAMWKWEARGKVYETSMKSHPSYFAFGYKHRAYSPNRVKYPLKRVDWDPKGNRNPQNRGKSKFKRISWDEATDIIASEIKRIHDKYGTKGVYAHSRAHGQAKSVHKCHGAHSALLAMFGPCTTYDNNPDSWEGWFWGGKLVAGAGANGHLMPSANVIKDVAENSEMIVHQGSDWETTPQGFSGQFQGRTLSWLREVGIKQVFISPDLNYAAAVHADKWIPVLPNTDAALQLAVIYTWITEGTYDKDYVATHTVGFDKVSDYVLGKEDGVPKTPAWASPRCGVPTWTIKALAREWASKRTSTAHYFGGSFIRGPYSHEPARLEYVSLGMQGVGKPGIQQIQVMGMAPRFVDETRSLSGAGTKNWPHDPDQKIALTMTPGAVLNPPIEYWGGGMGYAPVEDLYVKRTYPAEGGTEIHMWWTDCPCMSACWNNGNYWIEAFRSPKIEFLLAQHPWFENDMAYADIILPGTTVLEDEDIIQAEGRYGGERRCIWIERGAIGRVGETMSDYEAVGEIAKKLEKYGGVYADAYNKYTEGLTVKDKIKRGYEKSGVTKLITWEQLSEKGYYCCPIAPDWKQDPPGLRQFYEDPVKNPRDLPSGKLEFYSGRVAEVFPNDNERPPIPKWVPGGPGWTHDESIEGERVKKYPLLMMSNHPRWRHHVQCDDIPWLREIPTCKVKGYDGYNYEPLWINPLDAAKKGIESGDIVKIYNERGIVLGGAYVTERIKPGAVYMDHGTRVDLITDGIDRGGSINLICPYPGSSKNVWGEATSGYLVEVEKLSGDEYEGWRKKYPEAFARALDPAQYDPYSGLKFGAWVEGGI